MLAEQLIDLIREPALVAELERVPARRQFRQGVGESLLVTVEALRELPEDRSELVAVGEAVEALVEALGAPLDHSQALDVGDVAAHLHGEDEPWGTLLEPVVDRRL